MGIPAYFKRLIDLYKALLSLVLFSEEGETTHATHLHLDLNCAIYHCVRKLQKTMPYSPHKNAEWETALCEEVFNYILVLVRFVKPSKELNIAIDGVVPLAKMRQQRQRRFKSAFMRAETARIAEQIRYEMDPQWDTNAITPGTEFMAKLAARLHAGIPILKAEVPSVILSDASEPSEGEHKVMARMRSIAPTTVDYHVVYGLDADLIMLSMLQVAAGHRVALLREAVEFGKIKLDDENREILIYFDICRLSRIITYELSDGAVDENSPIVPELIRDYVFLCSLLGNDFVPHGFSLAIHEDGLERAIEIYIEVCTRRGLHLIETKDGDIKYNTDVLAAIFDLLAEKENEWLLRWRKKRSHATPSPRFSADPLEYELNKLEEWPTTQMHTELAWQLPLTTDGSVDYYYEQLLGYTNIDYICNTYLQMLEWVLQYYTGKTVDTLMYYPWNIPPLWKSLAERNHTLAATMTTLNRQVICSVSNYVTPQQQSAMVFPMSSYSLVSKQYRHLPAAYPEYFPIDFNFYVIGKRFLWQCEAMIPLLPVALICEANEVTAESAE